MRRVIILSITAASLAACTRGGSSSSDQSGVGTVGAAAPSDSSAAGTFSSSAGGEVTPNAAGALVAPGTSFGGLGLSTVVTPGNNIPSPGGVVTGSAPAPAITGVPTSPIVGMGGSPGQINPPPSTTVPTVPVTPASPALPSTPPGLVPPTTPIVPVTPAVPSTPAVPAVPAPSTTGVRPT